MPTGRARARRHPRRGRARTLDEFGAPHVVKADGLAAGKGVLVTDDRDAALAHAAHYLQQGPVLVEEFLDGQEVSLFLLADGTNVLPLSPAQDYKRLARRRRRARTPAAWAPTRRCRGSTTASAARRRSSTRSSTPSRCRPSAQLAAEQTPFIGLLYAGLILTRARHPGHRVQRPLRRSRDPGRAAAARDAAVGPAVRRGDGRARRAAASRRSGPMPRSRSCSRARGTPRRPRPVGAIEGLDAAASVPGVHVAHAATAIGASDGGAMAPLIATGGRVLNVVAVGDDFAEARRRAYEALGHLRLEGGAVPHRHRRARRGVRETTS